MESIVYVTPTVFPAALSVPQFFHTSDQIEDDTLFIHTANVRKEHLKQARHELTFISWERVTLHTSKIVTDLEVRQLAINSPYILMHQLATCRPDLERLQIRSQFDQVNPDIEQTSKFLSRYRFPPGCLISSLNIDDYVGFTLVSSPLMFTAGSDSPKHLSRLAVLAADVPIKYIDLPLGTWILSSAPLTNIVNQTHRLAENGFRRIAPHETKLIIAALQWGYSPEGETTYVHRGRLMPLRDLEHWVQHDTIRYPVKPGLNEANYMYAVMACLQNFERSDCHMPVDWIFKLFFDTQDDVSPIDDTSIESEDTVFDDEELSVICIPATEPLDYYTIVEAYEDLMRNPPTWIISLIPQNSPANLVAIRQSVGKSFGFIFNHELYLASDIEPDLTLEGRFDLMPPDYNGTPTAEILGWPSRPSPELPLVEITQQEQNDHVALLIEDTVVARVLTVDALVLEGLQMMWISGRFLDAKQTTFFLRNHEIVGNLLVYPVLQQGHKSNRAYHNLLQFFETMV